MELALHIGTAKTGTTTFQTWCMRHRDWLAGHGVHYPRAPGNLNHTGLTLYARDLARADHFFLQDGIRTPEEHAAYRDRLRRALHAEIAASPARRWVMSNEHLHYMLSTPEMVARLRALLLPYFDRIRVFVHLRPQVDVIVSMASQDARLGRRVSRAGLLRPRMSPENPYFDYRGLIARWSLVFGAEAVEIVPFRRIPCMVGHLMRWLELSGEGPPPVERINEALGWRTIALANCIERPLLTAERQLNPDREMFIEALPPSEPLRIGADLARELNARFVADNTALIRSRPEELQPDDLTPDWGRHGGTETLSAVEQSCAFREQLNAMVLLFNQALRRERAARLRCEADLAERSSDNRRARALRRQAGQLLQGLSERDGAAAARR